MDFTELVKNNLSEMPKSQQKVAKYILDNFNEALFDTAHKLAKKVSVSETTVIRLSHTLGFEGYTDMNKAMRRTVIANEENINQKNRDENLLSDLSYTQFESYIQSQIKNGNNAYQGISFDEFKKICEIIMNKEKVLIIGYMDSFGVASELIHVLNKIRKKVYFYRLPIDDRDIIYDMDENSLLIIVSFSPHYKYTLKQAKTAVKGGCTVLTISNEIINPYTNLTDHLLVFNLDRNPEINLIDVSPVNKFIFFMINYMYSRYLDCIQEYRNSDEMRKEEYIE